LGESQDGQGIAILRLRLCERSAVEFITTEQWYTISSMADSVAKHEEAQKLLHGASYDQYAPRLDKRVNGMVREWSDLILFASVAIARSTEKDGMGYLKVWKQERKKTFLRLFDSILN
jgi:hypothetical protein